MIEPPFYRKDAKPTPEGWRHPTTGELLKPQKLTEDEINKYLGIDSYLCFVPIHPAL